VALDPVYAQLPKEFASRGASPATELAAVARFSLKVIEIIAPLVRVVKINSAYFEHYGGAGLDGYFGLVGAAHAAGLVVIGDVKRGDVGHSAEQYAAGHLPARAGSGGERAPDAITINGYFGWDGVAPFAKLAAAQGQGVFVLVRTSNPSAAAIQDQLLSDGRKVHEAVAAEVTRWNAESGQIGAHGYGPIGAVVATRDAGDAAKLRAALPHSILLVPGYGAQGGRAEDFAPYFKPDGTGAIVAAGRSVIFAQENAKYRERFGEDWERCIAAACEDFAGELSRVLGRG